MQSKSFTRKMSDGTEIWCNRWIPDEDTEIKGIVQLHHGLAEHCLRYDRLGSILAENGYVLNAFDLRGHGQTGELAQKNGNGRMGKLANHRGDKAVISDLYELISDLHAEYKGKKVFLVGHSFGSFVSQGYIENYSDRIDGCILIGTAGPRNAMVAAGHVLAKLTRLICGPNKIGKALQKISFAGYNDKIDNPKTANDWLSKNEMNREFYEMDNWCGIPLTVSFFDDMTKLLGIIHKAKNIKKISNDLPVMFLYGTDDPVGTYGKTINNLYEIYKKNGIKDLEIKSYEGDRHEILNEDDKETVENDIISWLNKHA